jgi:asparagine synthase (glutamine-hydrolysing)
MFFSAYVGADGGLPLWREALTQHARHLGLGLRCEARRLADYRTLSLGWLEHAAAVGSCGGLQETEQQVVAGTTAFDDAAPDGDANVATLTASLAGGEIRVAVPPASPQQVCYARTPYGYVFADDLRLFPGLMPVDVDERAVYALLRYGAIPPPFTFYAQVQRIPTGHELRLPAGGGEPVCTPTFRLTDLPHRDGGAPQADQWVAETLDAILARVPPSAVLYFSGGVDSGLMAARLSRLGRNDVRLVNYCFSPEDEESRLAFRMAARLGFECHQIRHDALRVGDMLDRVGRDYSFPFGDLSAIPTNLLVHESLPLAGESRTVIEGTGADGTFGLSATYREKWERAYHVPLPLRRGAEAAYRGLRLWKYRSRLEAACRLLSRSARLPLGHAVLAQNALQGIAYTTPDDVQAELEWAIRTSVEVMSAGTETLTQLSLLDLVWACAGRMAPKSFDALRAQGIRPLYPFLQPSMVSVSASLPWVVKCTAGQDKALLKRLLARDIPPEWVHRPKTGFTRSPRAIFALAPIQAFLHDVVLSSRNALLDYCKRDTVRQLVERSCHHALGDGACAFLWVLMFTSGWMRQLSSGAESNGSARRAYAPACGA